MHPTNKAHRNEIKGGKYKSRVRLRKLDKHRVWHTLKSQSVPCSCPVCSHNKYNRAKVNNSWVTSAAVASKLSDGNINWSK